MAAMPTQTATGLTRSASARPVRSRVTEETVGGAASCVAGGPWQPVHSGRAARNGAEHLALWRQFCPHSEQKWKCAPRRAPATGSASAFGKHQGQHAARLSRHRPSCSHSPSHMLQ